MGKLPTSLEQMQWILTELSGRKLSQDEVDTISFLKESDPDSYRVFENLLIDIMDNPVINLGRKLNTAKKESLEDLATAIFKALKNFN